MKTNMAATSLEAYEKLVASGKDQQLRARVLKHVLDHPGVTRQQITEDTGIPLHCVCRPVNVLVEEGLLVERGVDRTSGNGRKLVWPVGPTELRQRRPVQAGLF